MSKGNNIFEGKPYFKSQKEEMKHWQSHASRCESDFKAYEEAARETEKANRDKVWR